MCHSTKKVNNKKSKNIILRSSFGSTSIFEDIFLNEKSKGLWFKSLCTFPLNVFAQEYF